jgi:hypothetical protein
MSARPSRPVPHTVTPCARAASRSMAALPMPVVTSSRRLGSRSNTSAGNGVRSLMATTISQSWTAATSSSVLAKCSRKLAARTLDQPASPSATSW